MISALFFLAAVNSHYYVYYAFNSCTIVILSVQFVIQYLSVFVLFVRHFLGIMFTHLYSGPFSYLCRGNN